MTRKKTAATAWSNADINFVATQYGQAQQNRQSARECAFRIGERLNKILSGEEKYGKSLLKDFLAAMHMKKHILIKEQTGYGYLHLYRGAGSIENACNLDVPQKYWEILGTDRWGNDIFSTNLVLWFREHPLLEGVNGDEAEQVGKQKDRKPSAKKLATVIELLEAHRARLKAIDPGAETDINKMITKPIEDTKKGWKVHEMFMAATVGEAVGQFQYDLSLLAGERVRSLPITMSPKSAKLLGLTNLGSDAKMNLGGIEALDGLPKPSTTELIREHTAKGLSRVRRRQSAEIEVLQGAPQVTTRKLGEMLKHGDCRMILRGDWIAKGSLDAVVTDPPYGEYAPWRSDSRVEHHSEGDSAKDANMVAEVARIIVERGLHRPRFVWMSFCPTDLIHVFAPPLIKAFAPLKPIYQVLIWDKAIKPPSGGIEAYSTQCESILRFSINRALPKTEPMSPIYIERKEQYDLHWKPLRLLQKLIKDATYGEGRGNKPSGQIILDPFAGKGGTGIAAIFSGVDARLIEVDKNQFSDARIEVVKAMKMVNESKGDRVVAMAKYIQTAKKSMAKSDIDAGEE